MSKFLVLYMSDISVDDQVQTLTQEEAAASTREWNDWATRVAGSLADFGLPVGTPMVVEGDSGPRPTTSTVTGYSVVEAADVEAAAALMAGHPHLKGGTIELLEAIPIPGLEDSARPESAERRGSTDSGDDRY